MKKHILISTFSAMLLVLFATAGFAACSLGVGSICIQLQDQFGQSIVGDANTVVDVYTEGPNALHANPDYNYNMIDGGVGDEDGVPDGDVEISEATLTADGAFNGVGTKDWYYTIRSTSGYVSASSGDLNDYSSIAANNKTVQLLYTIKVNVKNQAPFGDFITTDTANTTVTITNATNCSAVFADNGVSDMDSPDTAGELYLKCPVDEIVDPMDFTIAATGYVDYTSLNQPISNAAQTTITSANEFTLMIASGNIQDELGNNIVPANANPAGLFPTSNGGGGTINVVDDAVDSGNVYVAAAAGGPANLTIRYPGYLESSVAVSPSAAAQNITYAFTGASDLSYQIVVNYGAGNMEDELGTALAFNAADAFLVCTNNATWAGCTGSSVTVTANQNGANWYLAPAATPGSYYVGVTKSGYVSKADGAAVVTNWTAAVNPAWTSGAGDGLPFGLKVVIRTQLGADLDPGALTTLTFAGNPSDADDGVNTAYFANTSAVAQALVIRETGYIAAAVTNTGLASFNTTSSAQTVINLNSGFAALAAVTAGQSNDALGLNFTLKVTAEDELNNVLNGGAVAQTVGSAVGCTEDGATGIYYCPVPDTEATDISAAKAGYVTRTMATAGNANEAAGPQLLQDLTDGSGNEVLFTLRVNAENEINGLFAGGTVAQTVGSLTPCNEDGATGVYFCAVPNGEATNISAAKAGFVTAAIGTAGNAATAGPQVVQDLTDGSGNEVLFTLRVNLEDELNGLVNVATVAQTVGSAVSCAEDGATSNYYCAVPDGEATDVSAAKDGYVTRTVASAGNAAVAGPQVVQNMTDGSGNELQFTLRANIEDELNNVFTGGTVAQSGGSAVGCTEEPATGFYYCAVPAGEATAVSASLNGYVTRVAATAGNASAAAQTVQDMTDGTGKEVQFSLRVNVEDELNNVFTTGTVAQTVGSAVGCNEDGVTGFYYCAVLAGEATDVSAAKAGYVTRAKATAGNANAITQLVQDMTDGTGSEVQFTLRVDVENEINAVLSSATVAQTVGSLVGCNEDGTTGFYYCAVPNGEATNVSAAKTGFVTQTVASAGNAATAGPQLVQNLTDGSGNEVLFTLRVDLQDELGGVINAATVAQTVGSLVGCAEDGLTSSYYCAVPNGEATDVSASKAGYVTRTAVSAGAANEAAGPQVVQNMTDGTGSELQFTLRVNVEDELNNVFTVGTVAQTVGSAVGCTEDGATGFYFCAVPDGEATNVSAAKAGYVTRIVASAGNAASAGPQVVQDLTDGTGSEVLFTLKVVVEDELNNVLTVGAVSHTVGSMVACNEDGATGNYYCAVPAGEGTNVSAAKAGYVTRTVASAGNATIASQTTQNLIDGSGNEVLFTLRVNAEDELNNAFTGGVVAQTVGSLTPCNEDPATGNYYCAVPNGEATDISAAKAGYVTRTAATAGNAATSGPQIVQDLTDGSGNEVLFTLRVNAENEINGLFAGGTVAQTVGSLTPCNEDGATGVYFCAVPDTEATNISAAKAGFVTAAIGTAGNAATAGPQVVQDLTDGSGNELLFTLRVNLEHELNGLVNVATVAQTVGSAVSCAEDGATSNYYCAVPDGEATDVSAARDGYVTRTVASAGNAAVAGPQLVQDMTDGSGNELQFTLRANIEDELNNAFTGGTVAQSGGSAVGCTEDPATGFYYCAVPAGEATAVSASLNGYVTRVAATAGNASAAAQTVQDMTDGTGKEVQFSLRVNVEDELNNVFTTGTVAQTVGSLTPCNEDGATGFYYCAVLAGEATDVSAAKAGYVTRAKATAGNANAITQLVQDMTDGTGSEVLFTLKVIAENELNNLFTGGTVAQTVGSLTPCNEDPATGIYYCAVPNGEATDISAAKAGYVTRTVATGGNANEAAGPQITQDLSDGTGNEVLFTLKVIAEDELNNLFTGGTVAQTVGSLTPCNEDPATGIYYCAVPNGEATNVSAAKDGYVTRTVATGGNANEAAGPQITQDMSDGTGNEVLFTLRVIVEDELNNITSTATVAHTVGSAVSCAEDGATGYYYCAVPNGEATNISAAKSGFSTRAMATAGLAAAAGPQLTQDLQDGTGNELLFIVKISSVQNEIGGAIALAGGDTAKLYTDSCVTEAAYLYGTPTWDAGSSSWYIAVADGTYYGQYGKSGYVNQCDATSVVAAQAGAQVSPSFTQAGGDGLDYVAKFNAVQDEIGNALTPAAGDTVKLYSNPDCTGEAVYLYGSPTWDAGTTSWYAAVADGTYYGHYSKTGFVDRCDATSVAAAQAGPQVIPTFTSAGSDGLQYGLLVTVSDQFNQAVTAATLTHGGTAPLYASQGASFNKYYFNTAAVAAQLIVTKAGFQTIDSGAANVTPGGGAVAQTTITLTGAAAGDLSTFVPVAGGANIVANGLVVQVNVELSVVDQNNNGITDLGNLSNFYFLDGGAARVMPDYFVEIDSFGSPGLYQFKVPLTAVSVQVKAVDNDGDPFIDFEDSVTVPLTGLTALYQDFGTATVYPRADFLQVTSVDGTLPTGGTEVLTVTIRDNDGNIITAGPNATRNIALTISGGGTGTDISATTLANPSPADYSGTNDTIIYGNLTGGTADVTMTDTAVGSRMVSLAPATGTLPQEASSTVATPTLYLPIMVTPGAASQIVVLNPTDNTVDNNIAVTFQVQDANGNVVTSSSDSFTVNLDGSAVGVNATTGSVISGGGQNSINVQAAGGVVVLNISDTAAPETVNITLSDNFGTGLDVTSTQDVIFSPGVATEVVLDNPADATAGSNTSVTARVEDQFGNLVTSSTTAFTMNASGDATYSESAPPVGTLSGGAGTGAAVVQAAGGLVTLTLTDTTAETVNLSLNHASLTDTSTQNAVFSPAAANQLVFLNAAKTLTAGTESATVYQVQVQDQYGNRRNSVASDVTINLSSTSTGTVTFSATSGGASVSSVTITAASATDTATFYYKDTKAGSPTISVAATLLTGTTQQQTVNPAAAVSGVTITTTQRADTAQPTDQSSVQTATGFGGSSLEILVYPYTLTTDNSLQIVADGTRGKVTVNVKDTYGNIRYGDTVALTVTGTGTASLVSNSNGTAIFDIYSSAIGTASVQATVNTVNYGSSFSVIFKSDDTTPPEIDTQASAYSLVNGDMISPTDAVVITTALSDPGTDASGVDLTSIDVDVTNSAGATVLGTLNTTGCALAADCEIRWTPTTALPAGSYTLTLTVQDNNANIQTQQWSLRVSGGTALEQIAAAPDSGDGIFNPLAGGNMKFSFQAPSAGTVTLEVYRRDGRLVYSTSAMVSPGYNEILWNGLSLSGSNIANGIYVFRLRASLTTGTTEQTGKLAIFKK